MSGLKVRVLDGLRCLEAGNINWQKIDTTLGREYHPHSISG
jgi:hypothetical protein